MSEAPFDVREQLARIDRMIAETQKFQIEQIKLQSQARKPDCDRSMAPWQIAVVTMSGLAALLGGMLTILASLGL